MPKRLLIAVLLLAACGGGGNTGDLTGEQLAGEVGCLSCHTDRDTSAAPTLVGIWGDLQLADGRTVTADEGYVRRSIIEPGADIVECYSPIMPTIPLEEDEVDRLVDWVRSLG